MSTSMQYLVAAGVVAALAAVAYFSFNVNFVVHTETQACTTEAKMCPDGSAVGRTGPNCEFTACPPIVATTTSPVKTPAKTPTKNPVATTTATSTPRQGYECNQDAKTCPDGSTVGRTGPTCEFTACPPSEVTSATLHTTMGQKVTGLNVSITPTEIVSDSRCASDVQCVWAGTVELGVNIQDAMGPSETTLTLGKPFTTEAETITLTDVSPDKNSDVTLASSDYRFTFTVTKK